MTITDYRRLSLLLTLRRMHLADPRRSIASMLLELRLHGGARVVKHALSKRRLPHL